MKILNKSLKFSKKLFTTTNKETFPLSKNPYNLFKPKITPEDGSYETLYLNYHNVEHKAFLPKKTMEYVSCSDFLDYFANEKSTSKNKFSGKDFELYKTNTYIPANYLISAIETEPESSDPLTILDQNLENSNLKFRNLSHLVEREFHSQKLQNFLNNFLTKFKIEKTDIKTQDIFNLIKSGKTFSDEEKKIKWIIPAILNNINSVKASEKVELEYNFKANFNFGKNSYNNNVQNLSNIFTVTSLLNQFTIPITIFTGKIEEENNNRQSQAVLENLNTLRKLSIFKYEHKIQEEIVNVNFGIVTNLKNWKFTFYHRPKNYSIETQDDYLVSLNYELGIDNNFVNLDNYLLLIKIFRGLLTIKEEEAYCLTDETLQKERKEKIKKIKITQKSI